MNTIKLQIEKESDLYNPFDPEGEMLSGDVKDYILERMHAGQRARDIEIQIISEEEIDEEKTEAAIHRWINEEERRIRKEFHSNVLQMLFMFGVGVLFILLSIVLQSKVHVVWFTVLSTIGAFSMWEAASIWIIRNPKLKRQRSAVRMQPAKARRSYGQLF